MNSKLDEKLRQFEKQHKIENDEELLQVLEQIIEEEESLPPTERDIDLIEEAVQFEVSLKYGDIDDEISEIAERIDPERLIAEFSKSGDAAAVKPKKKKKIFRWLIPVAAVFAALVILTSFAEEDTVFGMARHAFIQLKDKIFYREGDSDIIRTDDYGTYQSVEEFEKNTTFTDILLPHNLKNGYTVEKITVDDYGVYDEIDFIANFNEKTYYMIITIPNSIDYSEFESENIGGYEVYFFELDNIIQGEFIYKGNNYLIQSDSYESLKQIIESLEEKQS